MKKIIQLILKKMQKFILLVFDIYFSIRKQKKYQFIIGVDEIGNMGFFLKNVFKKNTISINLGKNKFYKNNIYDYSITASNKYFHYIIRVFYGPYLLAKLSNQADVFIYIWWTGFCLDREIDYKFLKSKNKKIVCIFLGSDIRSHQLRIDYHIKHDLDTGSNYMIDHTSIYENETRVKRVACLADKYADLIFNPAKDQPSYLKSKQYMVPHMQKKELMFYDENKFDDLEEILIVHASTRPVAKGTPLVRAAIKKLKVDGYKFKYIELFNTSNEEVLEMLKKSHVLLNQFYSFAPGTLSIEGMSNCNAVITSADYDDFPEGAEKAWLKTKYWEVYDNLKYLLDNPDEIKKYALNGYEFVKNNFLEKEVEKYYINLFHEHGIIDDKSIF